MLYSLLEKSAKNRPDAIALWSNNSSCTYFELNEKVKKLSNGLLKKGLRKGDRIASYLHNCPEAIQLFFACFKLGVTIVVIHPFFSQFEIRLLIETTRPKLFITHLELFKTIEKLTGQFSSIIQCFYLIDYLHNDDSNILSFADLLDNNDEIEEAVEVTGEQEAAIYLTSGTTGRSKCVQSTHNQLLFNVKLLESYSFDHNDKVLLITAMHSATGLNVGILPSIHNGCTICYLPSNLPNNEFIKNIAPVLYKEKITYMFCTSSILRNYIEAIEHVTEVEYRTNFLRYCFVGGEKCFKTTYEKAKKYLGLYPIELYGMTETGSFSGVTANNSSKYGGFQPADKTIKFRITNNNWEDMPFNTCGEITLYSNAIMTGYVNDEESTQKVMKNGWLKTGDLGYLESNGILHIVGRLKQVIIWNGFNISLLELEEILLECNDVHEVCVTSISYMESEKPIAYVTLRSCCSVNVIDVEQQLFSYLKEKLPEFKIPLHIRILDVLPKNMNGKIDRKKLSERALEEFGQN